MFFYIPGKLELGLKLVCKLTTTSIDMSTNKIDLTAFETPAKAALNPEVIQALTPIVLAVLGGLIGCLALFVPGDKATAALGLAGTAFAGAAGLAKSESFSVEKKGENVKVTSPSSQTPE